MMYIARNKDGEFLWKKKPLRDEDGRWYNYWVSGNGNMILDSNMFPELKWIDEPIEVELVKIYRTGR